MSRVSLAAQVAALRALGMTHREVAHALGISESYEHQLAVDPDGGKIRARKERYRGTCESCGAKTDGSGGRAKAPRRCATCAAEAAREARYWTRERIVAAVREWARIHGQPPRSTDWRYARPGVNPPMRSCYGRGYYGRLYGWTHWADLIEEAGFPRPRVGQHVRTAEMRRRASERRRLRRSRERTGRT